MSKRLIRLGSEKIHAALNGLLTHEINAVLQNGNTYFGKLVSFTSDYLILNDKRSHPHHLALADLYEIIYDATQQRRIK
ncbi:hypothetical protein [Dyadobacter arcticus]|uniref:Uncharacterized protein n=1 Tax=Dyadobacter arcticus TaxID=1078754 RepID=A0ABX0UGM6_9BACT|nr:hypothetical protein [Dyadobacter arcticus]NIJ52159.1 hypothetical protein [Dyadobacter arcticus]